MLLDLIQMVHITVAVPLIKLFTYTDQGVEIKKKHAAYAGENQWNP